jgi:hypothetical protein
MERLSMTCCDHCIGADEIFSRKTAERDLKRYNRKGPDKSTRLFLNNIRKQELQEATLIDIGGGIGAVSFELFKDGLAQSVYVDASTGYLDTSKKEAEQRGLKNRINYLYGDFTDIADKLNPADYVTLDRVVCCYPHMEELVEKSAGKCKKQIALVYPRDRLITRFVLKIGNLWFKIRQLAFRTYLHPPESIGRLLEENGFRLVFKGHTFVWESVVYERNKV